MLNRILILLLAALPVAAKRIPVDHPAVFFSPYNTYSDGAGPLQGNNVRSGSTFVQWVNPGAYFKLDFSGTSFRLRVDTRAATQGNMPKVQWSLDNRRMETYYLKRGDESIALASGLPAGNHTLAFYLAASDSYADRWEVPVQSLKVTGIEVDEDAVVRPPSGPLVGLPRRALFFGDSITEGMWLLGGSSDLTKDVAYDDAFNAWPAVLADALEAEYGACGFGKHGWLHPTPDVPPLPDSWAWYFKGRSRLFSGKLQPQPDYLFINLGTNDGGAPAASITAPAVRVLRAMREAVSPSTPIFVLIPFGQQSAAGLKAAVAEVRDPRTVIVDLGPRWSHGLNKYGVAARYSYDGLHPDVLANGRLAAALARAVGEYLDRWR